jgi:hypothetical protein
VASADAEDEATTGHGVDGRGGGNGHGRVTADEVGDARGEADALRPRRGERQCDPRVHGVAGGVRDPDEVEPARLAEDRHARRVVRPVGPEEEAEARRTHGRAGG